MPYGKTLEMITTSRVAKYRSVEPREKTARDRSLSGKKRIKARRAANKA